jgi:PAS domain S-box-containing protein
MARPDHPDSQNRRWWLTIALGGLAFVLVYSTVLFSRDDGRIASIWPLNAVMLVVLMRWPPRTWLLPLAALATGNIGANIALGDDIVRAALLASANLLEVWLAASLLVGKYTVRLTRRSGFVRFLTAAVLACSASTVVATLALLFRGGNPPIEGATLWFAAHGLSLLIFTPPLAVAFAGQIGPLFRRDQIARTVIVSLTASTITVASFVQTDFPLLFVTPVMIVLVAFQLGLAGAALMTLLVAMVAIPLTLAGYGPLMLIEGSLSVRVVVLQAFLLLMSLTALLVGASVSERRTLVKRLMGARGRAQRKAIREGELLDQARLSEAISNVGYWTLTPATSEVFWSQEVYRIHGVDAATFNPGLDDALAFYVPEDRVMIEALIADRIASGEGWSFDATLVRRSDGELRNVRSVATCLRDASGDVVRIFGVFKDLTDERRIMAALAEKEQRYRLLADNATDVIAIYDMDGVFSYLSPSIHDMLGYTPEELVGRRSYTIMPPDEAKRVGKTFAKALPALENFSVEYQAIHKDGSIRWLEARPRPQFDAEGRVVGFIDNVRDVTDRREREAALAEARAVAEAATSTKAAFLANMSHEIRTPLNGVLGFAGLLSKTALDPVQARYVDRIQTAGTGLSVLINDILDVSRIEAGKLAIEVRPFRLRSLADEVVELIAAGASDKPIAFSVTVAPDVADQVEGDDTRIRQILLNVVGNAAKFTAAGTVALDIDREGSSLRIRVTDTGPGVPADQLPTLFDSFTQADGSITRRFGGTGLGLTISRSLARLMDGDLTMESEVGVGSSVTLVLPYRPASTAASVAQEMTAPDPAAAHPPSSLAIMVVDDVEMNREFVEIALSRAGHRVTTQSSAQGAIDALNTGQAFDLILMDVQMPVMDGLTATRVIRALPGPAHATPIIGLTANALPEQVAACRDAGMDDHIAKPVDPDRLVERVGLIAARRTPGVAQPDPDQTPAQEDALTALGRRYAEHLKTLPAELDRLGGQNPQDKANGLATLAHSVAGTAGSLGFPALSASAFELEDAAKRTLSGDAEPAALDVAIATFRQALDIVA